MEITKVGSRVAWFEVQASEGNILARKCSQEFDSTPAICAGILKDRSQEEDSDKY